MRVLVVAHYLFRHELSLWREVAKHVDLHVVGAPPPSSVDSLTTPSDPLDVGQVHLLPPRGLLGRGATWWLYPGLGRLQRRVAPDVTHVSTEAWGLLATQAARLPGPVVLHGADNNFRFGAFPENQLRLTWARRNLPRLSGYASWNQEGVDLARRYGLPAAAPTAVLPFIAPDGSGAPEQPRSAPAPARFGFVGRLVPEKGVGWLLDAMVELRARGVESSLDVVGTGPLHSELEQRAAALRLPATFHGSVPSANVQTMMRGWTALVVPSVTVPRWREQFGRVAAEALTAGTPVIASRSGALPDVIGPAGALVEEHDVRALAAAMLEMATDPAAWRRSHEAALQQRKRHRPEVLQGVLLRLWAAAGAHHER